MNSQYQFLVVSSIFLQFCIFWNIYKVNIGLPELIHYVYYSFRGINQIFVFLFYFVGEITLYKLSLLLSLYFGITLKIAKIILFSSCSILITSCSFLRRERVYNVFSVLLDSLFGLLLSWLLLMLGQLPLPLPLWRLLSPFHSPFLFVPRGRVTRFSKYKYRAFF